MYKEVFGLDDTTTNTNLEKSKSDDNNNNNTDTNTNTIESSTIMINNDDNTNNTGNDGENIIKKKDNVNTITIVKVKNALIRVRLEESAQNGRLR